jgi:hypothetical protein
MHLERIRVHVFAVVPPLHCPRNRVTRIVNPEPHSDVCVCVRVTNLIHWLNNSYTCRSRRNLIRPELVPQVGRVQTKCGEHMNPGYDSHLHTSLTGMYCGNRTIYVRGFIQKGVKQYE